MKWPAVITLLLCASAAPGQALQPFTGESKPGVDTATLTGKVMCGYQGWFNTPNDGANLGWRHWGKGKRFEPGACTIDLWPDVSELGPDERHPTAFRHADGSVAEVFSSQHPATVARHFEWMKDYGIDGAFVQRFASSTRHEKLRAACDRVLLNCRAGANQHGRAYALMYDLSGLGENQIDHVIADFKRLVDEMKLTRDPNDKAYLHHRGKPVVAVWGIGFNDGKRRYTLDDCRKLIEFLKNDPHYGGHTVMLGVPTHWRTLRGDAVADPKLHEIIALADIVSPWSVGRLRSPQQAPRFAERFWQPDKQWCDERQLDYLPVVFPGFSWHNLKPDAKPDAIPRLRGEFLWAQYAHAKRAGATMVYQAMFDEVDEGTAIFKCTNDPPVGASYFVREDGLPSDHYLWLVGQAARMVRGETPIRDTMPPRTTPDTQQGN